MSAETWAIVGVVVGALLSTVGQIVNAALQRKWTTTDQANALVHEKEQRLFDHKRQAHTGFIAAASHMRNAIYDDIVEMSGPPPPDDCLDSTGMLLVNVQTFGSSGTPALGETVLKALQELLGASREQANDALFAVNDALLPFIKAARADLGIRGDVTLIPDNE